MTSSNREIEGMSVLLILGMALGVAFVRGALLPVMRKETPVENAFVYGGGRGGCEVLQSLKRRPWGGIKPVGIIDDDPAMRNFVFKDIAVLGGR